MDSGTHSECNQELKDVLWETVGGGREGNSGKSGRTYSTVWKWRHNCGRIIDGAAIPDNGFRTDEESK